MTTTNKPSVFKFILYAVLLFIAASYLVNLVSGSGGGSDCDRLWSQLEADREALHSLVLSHGDVPTSFEQQQEDQMNAVVGNDYTAWQTAGCG